MCRRKNLKVHRINTQKEVGIKIECNKHYISRSGLRCTVINYDSEKLYPYFGRIENGIPGSWDYITWLPSGRYASDSEQTGWDIIKEA